MSIKSSFFPVLIVALLLKVTGLTAQDANAKDESLLSPLIEFSSVQQTDGNIRLHASIKAKVKGTLSKLAGLPLVFFATSDSSSTELGKAESDGGGNAKLFISEKQIPTNKEGKMHFKVVFEGNKWLEAGEEELEIKKANLTLTPLTEDSLHSVKLALYDMSTGDQVPLPQIGLNVYVKRMFGNLKIGEGTTDASGEALIEIPEKLPGDEKGNINVLARLDESEEYGALEAAVTQPWGTPVKDEIRKLPRALWSSSPPLWMLITFIVLMTTVWGHYIVIIYELFRLRKEHV
jgi:hypothetical protein